LSAPLRGVFSIPGSQFDFKVINFVPLGVGSLVIRYLKKLLEALTGRKRLPCIHEASSRSEGRHWYTTVTRP